LRLYRLQKPSGSTKKRKRVGRGPGSGKGKTSGRGHKGQMARSGAKRRAWSEGGQMPLVRRVPKRGFRSLNTVKYQIVNLDELARKFSSGGDVTVADLKSRGLIKSENIPVKILGNGDISVGLNLTAHAASKSAIEKINAAGGKLEIVKC
jgi:large subunit ribosomal protein L15